MMRSSPALIARAICAPSTSSMPQQNDADSEWRPRQAQSDPQAESALERIKELQEEAHSLDETLDNIEKRLDEAAGESRRL